MLAGDAEQVCRAQAVDCLLGERLCRLFLAFFQVLHVVNVLGPAVSSQMDRNLVTISV